MAVKVMIPTPLRAYAGKQESVECAGGDGGRGAFGADRRNLRN